MVKIGVISDTHGSTAAWETAVNRHFFDCDLIVHAGDILYHGPRNPLPEGYAPARLAEMINNSRVPLVFAKGNCDADIDSVLLDFPVQAGYAFLYVEGRSVLVTHGTELTADSLTALARRYKTDILISGHTHVPLLEKKNGTVFLNPGSCALPKGSEGATAAIWDRNLISVITLADGKVVRQIGL